MKYLPGYYKALEEVSGMDADELLEHMSHLFGAKGLDQHDNIEDIRAEAVRQTKIDFLDATADDYRQSLRILNSMGQHDQ